MSEIAEDAILKRLLSGQNLGVLATMGEEYPYTSLVGFAATEDLKNLVFATLKPTRKYANIRNHPKISILVNSGRNSAEDFRDAASVTVLGRASDAEGDERDALQRIFLSKFPFLEDFVRDPACVLVKVDVEKFIVVTRFQDVRELEP